MNPNLKYLVILFVLAAMIFAVNTKTFAQNGAGQKFKDMTPGQRADFQTFMMKSKLSLDSVQFTKVKGINNKYATKFQHILESNQSRLTELKAAEKLQEQKDTELKTIFTSAQFKMYKETENDMRKKLMDVAGTMINR